MKIRFVVLSLLAACIALPAFAQDGVEHLAPFAHGAGRTYAVNARGFSGALLNPALLSLGTERGVELSFLPITGFGAFAGPSFTELGTVTSADVTNDTSRQQIVNLLLDNKLRGNANLRIFGASYSNPSFGGLAFNWTTHIAMTTQLGDSLLDYFGQNALANLGQNTLSPTTTDVAAQWYTEYTLSYGTTIIGGNQPGDLTLSAGVGLKYISGIAYARLDPNARMSITPIGGGNDLKANYELQFVYPDEFANGNLPTAFSLSQLFGISAGQGFGADLGVLIGPKAADGEDAPYRIGLSITDIGSIHWTDHTDLRSLDTEIYIDYGESSDTLRNTLNQLGGTLDTTGHPFTSKLPTTLHLAGQVSLVTLGIDPAGLQMSIASEIAVGLDDVVSAPQNGRFGIAAILQRPSDLFGFRTALGMTTQDGTTDLTFALGFSIRNRIAIDFGTASLTGLFRTDAPTDGAVSLRLLF